MPASKFFRVARVDVPVFLIPAPGKGGGGGFNGGRLTVEVAEHGAANSVLLHELWHAFAESHRDRPIAAAKGQSGLDFETLSEGLAYAFVPGLHPFPDDASDWLARSAQTDASKFFDEPYSRFKRFAIALRPSLREALNRGESLEDYLPRALEIWGAVAALADAETRSRRAYFFFGNTALKPLAGAVAAKGHDAWARALTQEAWLSLAARIRPFDTVLLVGTPEELLQLPAAIRTSLGASHSKLKDAVRGAAKGELLLNVDGVRYVISWDGDRDAASQRLKPRIVDAKLW